MLTLVLIEEDSRRHWRLRFPEVQVFECVAQESAAGLLGTLPTNGAFYEVVDSPWLRELGRGTLEYMAEARHCVICCYDEVWRSLPVDTTSSESGLSETPIIEGGARLT